MHNARLMAYNIIIIMLFFSPFFNALFLKIVGEAFIWTLETGLDKEFTPEVREAWTIFYKMVADKMNEGLHEAHNVMDEKEA